MTAAHLGPRSTYPQLEVQYFGRAWAGVVHWKACIIHSGLQYSILDPIYVPLECHLTLLTPWNIAAFLRVNTRLCHGSPHATAGPRETLAPLTPSGLIWQPTPWYLGSAYRGQETLLRNARELNLGANFDP